MRLVDEKPWKHCLPVHSHMYPKMWLKNEALPAMAKIIGKAVPTKVLNRFAFANDHTIDLMTLWLNLHDAAEEQQHERTN